MDDASEAAGVQLLTADEKKAQAERCSCRGSDDYCPCQNVPDRLTQKDRAAAGVIASAGEKPRRRVVVVARIEGDSWDDISASLHALRTDIVMHGSLPPVSISGGVSSGWTIETSEDPTITHDSWRAELDRYVASLRKEEKQHG